MGEIADDCFDRAMDELMDPDRESEWGYREQYPRWRPQRPAPNTTADDFDVLE